jgi:hypothetical protein
MVTGKKIHNKKKYKFLPSDEWKQPFRQKSRVRIPRFKVQGQAKNKETPGCNSRSRRYPAAILTQKVKRGKKKIIEAPRG